jgi:hypothetical protein
MPGPRTLPVQNAAKAISEGDDAAAKQAIIKGLMAEPERTLRERFQMVSDKLVEAAPLGGISEAKARLYLKQLPAEERTKALARHRQWLRKVNELMRSQEIRQVLRSEKK